MTFRDHNFCIKLLFVSRTFLILFIYSLLNFCFIFYAKFLVEGHAYNYYLWISSETLIKKKHLSIYLYNAILLAKQTFRIVLISDF